MKNKINVLAALAVLLGVAGVQSSAVFANHDEDHHGHKCKPGDHNCQEEDAKDGDHHDHEEH